MIERVRRILIVGVATISLGAAARARSATIPPAPVAPVEPVVDDYYGTRVTDNYRWMEERSPRFVEWMTGQDTHARAVLNQIPGREALFKRINAHTGGGTTIASVQMAGERVFYEKRSPADNSFKLYVRETLTATERLLVDPDRFATKGGPHYAIDYYSPSLDGARLAYGVSAGGSENSVIHVLEVASGKETADTIDRTEYGSPSWTPDGRGFFYNRFAKLGPGGKETDRFLNSRAYLHIVGTDPESDVALIGHGLEGSIPITEVDFPFVSTSAGSPWAMAVISHGADPAATIYIAPADKVTGVSAPWRKVADVPDAVTSFAFQGSRLFLLTHKDAPRYKLVEVDAAAPDLARARVAAAPSERVIEGIAAAADGLYLADLDGGLGRLRRLDYATGAVSEVALPMSGSVSGPVTDPTVPGALYGMQGWISPPLWYRSDASGFAKLDIAPPWSEDTSAYEAEEVKATAPDGTPIPLSIIHRRGLARDGKNPVWLRGYGAYGISLKPSFAARFLAFLEDGGVLAVAHVRGGGEFGEDWHQGGRLLKKTNTHRDFIACAEYLHAHGYGSPATTAIEGGSAGGITVGMALTERPELFRTVLSEVGDSNALRVEHATDGPANSLEYGTTTNPDGFHALYAVDATQHVRKGTAYPAVLITTGINDPRVAPWQPGKMAAHLEAATSSGRPVLMRVDFDAGHGVGSTRAQRDWETADQLAFFYWQMGKPEYQPAKDSLSGSR
jgi:prolyl oligopeptidase